MTRGSWAALLIFFGALAACAAPPAVQTNRSNRHAPDDAAESSRDVDENPDPDHGAVPSGDGDVAGASCGDAPEKSVDTATLDPFFTTQMKAANAAGLAVAVVGGGRIKWAKGYGLANIAESKPATPDTLFMLASVSKTITAVALMQLIEDPARGLSLDQDINGKLPFSVRNPAFPSTPITYRMLLTHTSSLIDSDTYWAISSPEPRPQGDSQTSLLDFERSHVARSDSWSRSKPGTEHVYSNTATSLAGLLVETITGTNLQTYAKKNIFDRLGMKESSFFLRDLDPSHVAMPYDGTPLTAKGHYGYPDYPDGLLRTSARQLARFLLMFSQHGECARQRVLKETTYDQMVTVQAPSIDPTQGLIWYYDTKSGTKALGHSGADEGVSTEMFFDPSTGAGYVLLTNGSANMAGVASQENAMAAMGDELMQLASTLP